jgi:AcrR family transcriptional regulator/DNA-binding transcriptional ArsR family regulator
MHPTAQGVSLRRARILDAMVHAAGERGFAHVTVSDLCARARVSRGTFYETFSGREECFLAVIDDGHRRARALIAKAFAQEQLWQDGLRTALASLLLLFDEEPLLARVWFVEALAAGSWALERRERHVAALTATIVGRWPIPEEAQVSPLAAAAVMEAVLGILHTHLLTNKREPLIALLGPLMGLIVAIYADSQSAAAEIERCRALTHTIIAGCARESGGDLNRGFGAGSRCDAVSRSDTASGEDTADAVARPKILANPRAHRARRCLFYLAEYPGASNRQVASAIGVASQSQVSSLLARLARSGLLHKRAGRPGHANAWMLSSYGRRALDESTIYTERTLREGL